MSYLEYGTFHFKGCPQSNKLEGPPELVQHIGGVHIGARAQYVLNIIWFVNIARLWG